MEEQLIEVDKNDKIIGLRPRKDFHTGKYIHRSCHLILFNSKNKILLQKRAPTMTWYPNLYTFSVSGTVANETYEESIKKEMKEEIGISIPVKFLFKTSHFDKFEKAFHSVFIGKSDKRIIPDKNEMTEVKWISPEEVKKDIQEHPEKYTPSFVKGMKRYFAEFYGFQKV